MEQLKEFDPFDIFDTEAARLDRFFSSLDEEEWDRPTRCAGWSVRDVLAHLAGEELYNHACLDGDVEGFFDLVEREGVKGFDQFNQWCVEQRRELPVEQVLEEWRTKNGETRERMRALGREGVLQTSAGPYPVDMQTYHYDSEYATHADDVGAPVSDDERDQRTWWRLQLARQVLAEQGAKVQVETMADHVWVYTDGASDSLSFPAFVEATVGRTTPEHAVDQRIATALRCLA
ncbi:MULTISPECIES: maleylpyruvate isomerase family mycothiol-dependent enzyme [unclassified Nonomuraea]|uniref:maleylpyruvate isomerase family mycothiol-dependent enzyme n=1 Tax=Nonomuraea sp. NPDC003804 TaxID=3154547 RepID=UPI0033A92221